MEPTSWEELEKYLRDLSIADKRFEAGYKDFCYLMKKLQPYWGQYLNPNHPLTLQLLGAWRLKAVVTRIRDAEADPLVDKIITRLAKPKGYDSAYQELDIYRRLKLGGLQPSFIKEGKDTTPDMSVIADGHKVWVEVTSIMDELEVSPALELLGLQMELSISPGVLIGGKVKGPMSREDIGMLRADAEELAALAMATGQFQFRESDRWTVFAIEKTKAGEVPERFRNGFLFVYDRKVPHTYDIMLRIAEKMDKKYADGEAGFIVIYDRYMDNEELLRIMSGDDDQITQYLEAHPELLGIAVILPPGYTADLVTIGNKTGKKKIFRGYLVQPDNSPEMLLVWKNPKPAVDNTKIVDAFVSFERNQK